LRFLDGASVLAPSFVITDPKDIALILSSSIKEVWIDCTKGLDVPEGEITVSEAESDAQVEADLKQAAEGARQTAPVPLHAEIERAAKICNQSKQAVVSMFQEARMGKTVDAAGAQRLVEEISDSLARNASALISLARLKTADDYTYMHSVAVCAMMSPWPGNWGWTRRRPGRPAWRACCMTWARRPCPCRC
jgi:HD-GYP domain-containing protein (c-di-GMP phosphodiesterase class II)